MSGWSVTCDYCGQPASFLRSSKALYGKEQGPVWACLRVTCEAWAHCRNGTDEPVGRLANHELRQARRDAQTAFARLVQTKAAWAGISRDLAHGLGYRWLAKQLDLPDQDCRIGEFDVALCRRVGEICSAPDAEIP